MRGHGEPPRRMQTDLCLECMRKPSLIVSNRFLHGPVVLVLMMLQCNSPAFDKCDTQSILLISGVCLPTYKSERDR